MRRTNDFYETAPWQVDALVDNLPEMFWGLTLCPCVGDGSLMRRLQERRPELTFITNDIDPDKPADFHLDMTSADSWNRLCEAVGSRPNWVVDNFPFNVEHLMLPYAVQAARFGVVAMARVSFAGGSEMIEQNQPAGPRDAAPAQTTERRVIDEHAEAIRLLSFKVEDNQLGHEIHAHANAILELRAQVAAPQRSPDGFLKSLHSGLLALQQFIGEGQHLHTCNGDEDGPCDCGYLDPRGVVDALLVQVGEKLHDAHGAAPQGWQPIETAPTDGTRILGRWDGYPLVQIVACDRDGVWIESNSQRSSAPPDGWQHIPPLPASPVERGLKGWQPLPEPTRTHLGWLLAKLLKDANYPEARAIWEAYSDWQDQRDVAPANVSVVHGILHEFLGTQCRTDGGWCDARDHAEHIVEVITKGALPASPVERGPKE